jgi:rubrerythrin
MDLTDPFVGLVPRKMSDSELARAIRLNIAAEVDAINLYAAHMDATDNEAARRILAHIIDEEKEHLAEFLELLKILDPKQAAELGEAKAKIDLIINAPAGQTPADPSLLEKIPGGDGAPARDTARGKQLTVGGLRARK